MIPIQDLTIKRDADIKMHSISLQFFKPLNSLRRISITVFQALIRVLFLVGISNLAYAATINVNTQIGASGCDLIEAIQSANSDSAIGGCVAGSGADEITISGLHTINEPFDNAGAPASFGDAGLPTITTSITISSLNGTSEIKRETNDPLNLFRIFNVSGGSASLTLNDIEVSGGDVDFEGISSNDNRTRGGGIYLNFAELVLNRSIIKNNTAASFGGGIHTLGGRVTILDSLITGNTTTGSVPALSLNSDSEVVIINSTIENNMSSRGSGNAISALAVDNLIISKSSIINNTAGGINVTGGNLTMLDSTISGNINDVSMLDGISARIAGVALLGRIDQESRHRILNSTITNNPPPGTLPPSFIDIHGLRVVPPVNTSTGLLAVSVRNTIISDNGASGSNGPPLGHEIEVFDDVNFNAEDVFFEFSNNIIGHAGISESLALNNVVVDPTTNQILTSNSATPISLRNIINPLGNYGGPTLTHTLPPNSPAIDNGVEGNIVLMIGSAPFWEPGCRGEEFAPGIDPPFRNDQRGFSRPINASCDIGSTEFRTTDILTSCYVIKAANDNVITFCL